MAGPQQRVHRVRMWSARIAWISAAVAVLAGVRMTVAGIAWCPDEYSEWRTSPLSLITMWSIDEPCAQQALAWLMAGRIALLVMVAAVLSWRVAYRRDVLPD